ncbi:MAG: hypothetical protein D6B28_09940 [Gammaproteobacteria bacterium]|nr:MAG: hypothetical protein D6B28_09940 [Gammaproteobacteria bacterium]
MSPFKALRVFILLFILLMVAGGVYLDRARTTDWNDPLWVVVYPINGDGSNESKKFIENLDEERFDPVEDFFKREAEKYNLGISLPVKIFLAPELQSIPPEPPEHGSILSTIWWSLEMRYWIYSNNSYDKPADIKIFLQYFDKEDNEMVPDSLGIQNGLYAVVNGFASKDMNAKNNVVLAHELLHTVGASDKYDMNTVQPIYPIGYAEPQRSPVLPQRYAEIMAGRIPLTQDKAKMPRGLKTVVVGELTANEIRWIE